MTKDLKHYGHLCYLGDCSPLGEKRVTSKNNFRICDCGNSGKCSDDFPADADLVSFNHRQRAKAADFFT